MSAVRIPCCPICYEVIREPVVFPCRHEVCRECFTKSLETANLWCPLCRKRISSWARKNVNNPVDMRRKKEIQERLPDLGKENLPVDTHDGQTLDGSSCCSHKLSKPGEIKMEYISELKTVRKEREEEDRLGEAEARRLFQEEKQKVQEEIEREEQLGYLAAKALHDEEITSEQNQFEEDEKMAELLSQEFIQHCLESRHKQTLQDREFAKQLDNTLKSPSLLNTHYGTHAAAAAIQTKTSKKTPSRKPTTSKRTKCCSSKTQLCCVKPSATKPITFWLKPHEKDKL